MSLGSQTDFASPQTAFECSRCGFSVETDENLERCPRCWSEVEKIATPVSTNDHLIFAEASSEEETPYPIQLIEEEIPEELGFKARLKRWFAGYGLSLVIHGVLMLIAALIVFQVQFFDWHDAIQSSLQDGFGPLGNAGGLQEMQPIEFQVKTDLASSDWQNAAYHTAMNSLNAGEGGDAEGAGDGGVGFFGTRSDGNSFAFVVDVSGSMGEQFMEPDPNNPRQLRILTRWEKAREEILSAINAMTVEQSYCVLLYNNRHIAMYQGGRPVGLLKATASNREKTKLWLETIGAIGGTDPRESLAFALDLSPDVVYLLTDGEIPPESREVAVLFNRGKTVVHTTCIGYPKSDILQLIANDHRGQFRAITPEGTVGSPQGITLLIMARNESNQRQKLIRLEKDYEQIQDFLDNSRTNFRKQNTHSTLTLHNALTDLSSFQIELMKLLRSLNTRDVQGFGDSIRPARLGVNIPLDEERRVTNPEQILELTEEESKVGRMLRTHISESDFESFPQNVRAIYVFGDVDGKREIMSALEIFDLLNGSQIDLIDGDEFINENR